MNIGGVNMKYIDEENDEVIYDLVLEGDNTLKTFFERFFVIPKDLNYTDEELKFLRSLEFELSDPRVRAGKDGYIVERKGKKLSDEEVEIIKNDTGSYRERAKKYKLSLGTISKIMNDKY